MATERAQCAAEKSYKQRVAQSFGRAASSYDGVARLQRLSGQRLLRALDEQLQGQQSARVVDLGTGTGAALAALSQRAQAVLALDLAEGMLQFAQAQHADLSVRFIGADAERLPLRSGSVDTVYSNLVLQWTQLDRVLVEIQRILRPGGVLVFTTLLEGTLVELRDSWQAVDSAQHVNRFISQPTLQSLIDASELELVSLQYTSHQLRYRDSRQLLRELKQIGANFVPGRREGLTTRHRLGLLEQAYRQRFALPDSQLPASWQLAYVIMRSPKIQ